ASGHCGTRCVPDPHAHTEIPHGQPSQIPPAIAPILALYPIPPTQVAPGVGSIPEVDTQTGNENYLLGRVDYTMSNQDSLFVRYVRDFGDTTMPFLGSPLPPRWPEVGSTRNQFATIEWRRVISPTMVNLLPFRFTRTRETDVQARPDQASVLNFFPERHQHGGVILTALPSSGP